MAFIFWNFLYLVKKCNTNYQNILKYFSFFDLNQLSFKKGVKEIRVFIFYLQKARIYEIFLHSYYYLKSNFKWKILLE